MDCQQLTVKNTLYMLTSIAALPLVAQYCNEKYWVRVKYINNIMRTVTWIIGKVDCVKRTVLDLNATSGVFILWRSL
jgi:hypothetical protein